VDDSVKLVYNVRINDDEPDGLWAEVEELPGLFVSGRDLDELREALEEAIGLYLSTSNSRVTVRTAGIDAEQVRYTRVEAAC